MEIFIQNDSKIENKDVDLQIRFTSLKCLQKASTKIRTEWQGGHILAQMKFPVFPLSFPCVTEWTRCAAVLFFVT